MILARVVRCQVCPGDIAGTGPDDYRPWAHNPEAGEPAKHALGTACKAVGDVAGVTLGKDIDCFYTSDG